MPTEEDGPEGPYELLDGAELENARGRAAADGPPGGYLRGTAAKMRAQVRAVEGTKMRDSVCRGRTWGSDGVMMATWMKGLPIHVGPVALPAPIRCVRSS